MELIITPAGNIRALYSEAIPLATLGVMAITRASSVEPDTDGAWVADLSPIGGPQLGPFPHRSEALRSEIVWLERHWLLARAGIPLRLLQPS